MYRNLQQFDIIICVETWLTEKDEIKLPGFSCLRRETSCGRGGGIAYYIRRSLAFSEVKDLVSPEESVKLSGITLNSLQPSIVIIACYRSPGKNLTKEQWEKIAQNITSQRTLLVADFNAHNTMWNCDYTSVNGKRFENTIESYDIFLHNDNTSTFIDIHRNYVSNLDVALSTMSLGDKINVSMSDETWGSDHYPLLINIEADQCQYKKQTFKLYSLRTNWDAVTEKLDKD
uniref:Endonuclease/exonuclease/phosphatase domain-containing protein n=1 Tax=Trichogramma kaykai TaxID=54128 RepID=A0ABD2X066_9HYME